MEYEIVCKKEKSNFSKSYFILVETLKNNFNLSDLEAKEIILTVSEGLAEGCNN